MFTALSRVIKYGLFNFWRSGWLSAATIIIMIVTLIVFEGLIFFNVLTNQTLESLKDKIDISVYFNSDAPEDGILKIKKSLEDLSEVKKVEYLSREKALEIFKKKHKEDRVISEALKELNVNPLLASLNIKAYDTKDYGVINTYLNNNSFKNLMNKVSYAQNSTIIDRLNRIMGTMNKIGTFLTILFSFIAILITFNTIRLAIYSNREEIGIMRLVGASNSFISGPYVVEGIIYGIIAGIFSFIILIPVIYYGSPYIKIFIPEMNIWSYLVFNSIKILSYQILFGAVLGIISSSVAIRKYLKV